MGQSRLQLDVQIFPRCPSNIRHRACCRRCMTAPRCRLALDDITGSWATCIGRTFEPWTMMTLALCAVTMRTRSLQPTRARRAGKRTRGTTPLPRSLSLHTEPVRQSSNSWSSRRRRCSLVRSSSTRSLRRRRASTRLAPLRQWRRPPALLAPGAHQARQR